MVFHFAMICLIRVKEPRGSVSRDIIVSGGTHSGGVRVAPSLEGCCRTPSGSGEGLSGVPHNPSHRHRDEAAVGEAGGGRSVPVTRSRPLRRVPHDSHIPRPGRRGKLSVVPAAAEALASGPRTGTEPRVPGVSCSPRDVWGDSGMSVVPTL